MVVAAYHSVALLGEALGLPGLREWGQALAAVEAGAAQMYWQVGRQLWVGSGWMGMIST